MSVGDVPDEEVPSAAPPPGYGAYPGMAPEEPAPPVPSAAPPPGVPQYPGMQVPTSEIPGNEVMLPGSASPTELSELGEVPKPPELTGNQQQDVQNNLKYSRDLAEYGAKLQQHKSVLTGQQASVQAAAADKALAAQQEAEKQRQALQAVRAKRMADRQAQIDEATSARAAAAKDLEHHDPVNGGQIVAIIAGAFGAALQNYGAGLKGNAGTAQNQAVEAINAINNRDYQRKKDKLTAASDALREARYGYKDDEDNMRAGLNDIDADYAAKQKLIAAEAESQLRRAGVPAAQIAQNEIVLNARQQQLAAEEKIHEREEELEGKRQQAQATNALAQAHLEQGERQIQATQGFHNAEIAVRREEGKANRDERHWEHMKAEADRIDKAKERKAQQDQNLEVRDANGVVRGMAPSTRVVKQVQDRIVQYDDAIQSLRDLLAYRKEHSIVGKLPVGDEYDRAVLAVAATTQANASDATTKHEAGTIKSFGLLSDDAIKRTLAHLEKRQGAFMNQLRPVGEEPGGGGRVDLGEKGGPPPVKMVTVSNGKVTKQVTEDEARKLGAIK